MDWGGVAAEPTTSKRYEYLRSSNVEAKVRGWMPRRWTLFEMLEMIKGLQALEWIVSYEKLDRRTAQL